MQIAGRLGLTQAELVQDPGQSIGVGSTFTTHSSTIPILAQIIAYLPPPAGGAPVATLWGPQILMTPAFGTAGNQLLGQQDFFNYFGVTFDRWANPPVFHLDELPPAQPVAPAPAAP